MNRNGYRSWFATPPAIQQVRGHQYTTGGVLCFVRKDKGARLIQRHVANDGQALLLQLDHAYLIGVYLPPRGPLPEESLVVLDEVWTSRPHMVTSLSFAHTVIADHKAILFEVQYSQGKVQSFQRVPTRSLVQPPTLSHEAWAAALQNAWQTADCPTNSSAEQEWRDFCAIIEEKYSEPSASSKQVVHQSHPVVGRPKGSELKVQPIAAVTFRLKQHASCHELN